MNQNKPYTLLIFKFPVRRRLAYSPRTTLPTDTVTLRLLFLVMYTKCSHSKKG